METEHLIQLGNLLTGKTLELLQQERKSLEDSCNETQKYLQRFLDADKQMVKQALRDMLIKGDRRELPLLQQIIHEEAPQHRMVPLVVAAMRAGVPIWLYGETGSGKTTAAALAAKMLGLPFRFISVCPTTTKSEFFGYRDATGNYQSTAFREIYEQGGVFLIDEIDNGNPSILAVLNAALSNDYCAFPDGNIERHKEALFVSAANTIGRGADICYIGRNALDITTLDRFAFIKMDIDENLEDALMGKTWDKSQMVDIELGGKVLIEEWSVFFRQVRSACRELGIMHIISPRAAIYGQRLINAGVGRTHMEDMCIWKGIRETDKKKIRQYAQQNL